VFPDITDITNSGRIVNIAGDGRQREVFRKIPDER